MADLQDALTPSDRARRDSELLHSSVVAAYQRLDEECALAHQAERTARQERDQALAERRGQVIDIRYSAGRFLLTCGCGFQTSAFTLEFAGRQIDLHLAECYPTPSERHYCPRADRVVQAGVGI